MVALLLIVFAIQNPASSAITPISQDTLETWITSGTTFDFILIDVRAPSELKTYGLIATDSCRPYNFNVSDGTLNSVIAQIPITTPVVVYCQSGGRAATAATKLDSAGFAHVYRMATGVGTWSYIKHDSSFVKPASDLPRPSMHARSSVVINRSTFSAASLPADAGPAVRILPRRTILFSDAISPFTLLGRSVQSASPEAVGCLIDRNAHRPR